MEITQDIKYVGVNDHEVDLFEGQYLVPNGMAYNSYVVLDQKGKMTLNGQPVEEPYVFYRDSTEADFTVPEGHYLFLGDNRGGSNDARMWEQPYIPGDKICGKARFTLWPVANFGVLE